MLSAQYDAVMVFDAERRGRTISQIELNEYTRLLASAVTKPCIISSVTALTLLMMKAATWR